MKLAAARAVEMTVGAKPCGFRPHLGNRCAIPTFPPPRRLLDCFLNSTPERSFPQPSAQALLQAHSSIRKDLRHHRPVGQFSACQQYGSYPGPSPSPNHAIVGVTTTLQLMNLQRFPSPLTAAKENLATKVFCWPSIPGHFWAGFLTGKSEEEVSPVSTTLPAGSTAMISEEEMT